MALPEFTRQQVEKKLTACCETHLPHHVRDRVRMNYRIRDDCVTLLEQRLTYIDRNDWVDHPIAQFRFDPDSHLWQVCWPDRNSRWQAVDDLPPTRDFDTALAFVVNDRSGRFWR